MLRQAARLFMIGSLLPYFLVFVLRCCPAILVGLSCQTAYQRRWRSAQYPLRELYLSALQLSMALAYPAALHFSTQSVPFAICLVSRPEEHPIITRTFLRGRRPRHFRWGFVRRKICAQ